VFKRDDSTVNQLFAITHNIYKSLDSGKDVCAIFLDVSKAFDNVLSMYDHSAVTNKRKKKTERKMETGRNVQVD